MIDLYLSRSSRPEMFYKKAVHRNFAKFTGKHLSQSLFFNKVASFSLWKERLWHRCFHVNFVRFLRTPFLQNTSGRLLLSLWEDLTFHYKVPLSLSFISLKKIERWVNFRKKILFMFSRLHFKLWKINILHFLEKIQTTHK